MCESQRDVWLCEERQPETEEDKMAASENFLSQTADAELTAQNMKMFEFYIWCDAKLGQETFLNEFFSVVKAVKGSFGLVVPSPVPRPGLLFSGAGRD